MGGRDEIVRRLRLIPLSGVERHRAPLKIRGRGAALALPDQKATAQRARKTTRFRRAG